MYKQNQLKIRIMIIALITMLFMSMNSIYMEQVFAGTGEDAGTDDGTVTIYFTLSSDGEFVTGNDENETVLAHIPVTISYFDLAEYGLQDYYRYEADSFENGGAYIGEKVIERPTVFHLFIKMLEKYYLGGEKLEVGNQDQDALSITGCATSLYMKRFWGHDENLMYYVNHRYPLQASGWGSTSDYILLEDGMEIDVAMFSDWDFYHTGAFAYYSANGKTMNDHGQYEVNVGESLNLRMLATSTNAAYDGSSTIIGEPMAGEDVVYSTQKQAIGENTNKTWDSWSSNTDSNGTVTMTFDSPGIYYVSSTPLYSSFVMDSGNPCVAPPIAVINVKGTSGPVTPKVDYTGQLIDKLSFGRGITGTSEKYELSKDFSPEVQNYEMVVGDNVDSISVFTALNKSAPERTVLTASYYNNQGELKIIELEKGGKLGTKLAKLLNLGALGNTFTVKASCKNSKASDVSEEYQFTIRRQATIGAIGITDSNEKSIQLTPLFNEDIHEYTATVSGKSQAINITPINTEQNSYPIEVNGNTLDSHGKSSIKLDEGSNEIEIVALNSQGANGIYKINITLSGFVSEKLTTTEGSILQVYDKNRLPVVKAQCKESYTINDLTLGEEYSYTVTKLGYVSKKGCFIATDGGNMNIRLSLAENNNSIKTDIQAQWSNFRGNTHNNGTVDSLTPTDYKTAQLYWAKKVGAGYGAGAPSSPIIVDGYLVYTTATTIVKMDTVTGEIVASGKMNKTSNFNITPPTYADGMIFVALASGTIEAFNADTLESLWIYQSPNFGQPNSPITYQNGYIYTGFWSGETGKADFVCISTTDEDPLNAMETKTATWTHTIKGGFYWAGCYACNEFVLVGTEDGQNSEEPGKGSLIAFEPLTGNILDEEKSFIDDIRSTVCYDSETDRYYFTSKGGYLYSAAVSREAEKRGEIQDIKQVYLGGASTSTPVVHNGRAYVGVSGGSQFDPYNGHSIAVVDLGTMEIAYKLNNLRGYPQTSGLLTSGYETTDGYSYIYFIENYEPGYVTVIKDKPGQTEVIITREVIYSNAIEHNVLFSPKGEQANYAICSPIADEYGTIYFKNDSAYMMALGSKIVKIEVTKAPDKTEYNVGEIFNPTGMVVMATYSNGKTRDVTKYVNCSKETLTKDDVDVEVVYPYIAYNDELSTSEKFDPLIESVDVDIIDQEGLAKAKHVIELIDNITENITLESKEAIAAARSAYNSLELSLENHVTNYDKLKNAESTYRKLAEEYLSNLTIKVNAKAKDYQSNTLTWNSDKYIDGFVVYRYNSVSKKYEKLAKTTKSNYVDKGLKTGRYYYYKIAPYISLGDDQTVITKEKLSDMAGAKPGLQTTTIVSAKALSYNKVQVTWKKTNGAEGYVVYRATKIKGTYKPVATITSGQKLSYESKGLDTGTTYYFKVKAYRIVDAAKLYSTGYSLIKSAKPTLTKAAFKSTTSGKYSITLRWYQRSGASGYQLYRAAKASGKYYCIKTISGQYSTAYKNKSLNSKRAYYYKVRAYRWVHGKKVYGAFSTVKKTKTL